MKKIFVKLFIVLLVLILTLYISLFLYYQLAWKSNYSKQEVDILIIKINSAPRLTDSFYSIYDKIYKDRHERITTRFFKKFWTEFLMVQYPLQNNWQYVIANMQDYKGFRYKRAPMTLAFRINQDATPEKCFDYIMADRYSEYCKELKISDTITSLTDREQIIKFIIGNAKPRYSRFHPTKFKAEVDSIENILISN